MSLESILSMGKKEDTKKLGISEERIEAIKPQLRQYIGFWREYPDIFVDFLATGGTGEYTGAFKGFFFYQRVFLRAAMRHRKAYAVFPRGYSKSFLSVLVQMLRCILYPGAKLFTAAGGKSQSAGILAEKVDELCTLIPALAREIDNARGGDSVRSKDYCKIAFKNGSYIDNLTASEKSRGKRRQGGILEECVSIDKTILQEVLIPVMNISRRCLDGTTQSDEPLNQSELYITTAGYKTDYAYEKLIQLLVEMIVNPGEAFIMGGTYRIPVLAGLYDKSIIDNLKRDDTYNEASFEREYESKWTGTSEDAFFSAESFDRSRVIQYAETEYDNRSGKNSFYIIAVDVGRFSCASVAVVIKVTPQASGTWLKSIVNIYVFEDAHFEDQAIKLKHLFFKFKARRLVIDGNGVGAGLVDMLVKHQVNMDTGEVLPDFGVYNDEKNEYKKYQTPDTVWDAIYIIKANAPINTVAYSILKNWLRSGRLRFLIDERAAKNRLMGTVMGKNMVPEQRKEYLMPYVLTSFLKDEMINLREENEGLNIKLTQITKKIKKDKFSALLYGMYYIHQEEEENMKRKKKIKISDLMFYT